MCTLVFVYGLRNVCQGCKSTVTVVNFLFKPFFQEDTHMVGRFIYAYLTCKLILLGKKENPINAEMTYEMMCVRWYLFLD